MHSKSRIIYIRGLFGSGRIKHYLCWSSSFAYFHGGRTLCSRSYLSSSWGVKMALEKWAVGGMNRPTHRCSVPEWDFFWSSQYFSFACFLNLWWHNMFILGFSSTVNVLHMSPLKYYWYELKWNSFNQYESATVLRRVTRNMLFISTKQMWFDVEAIWKTWSQSWLFPRSDTELECFCTCCDSRAIYHPPLPPSQIGWSWKILNWSYVDVMWCAAMPLCRVHMIECKCLGPARIYHAEVQIAVVQRIVNLHTGTANSAKADATYLFAAAQHKQTTL